MRESLTKFIQGLSEESRSVLYKFWSVQKVGDALELQGKKVVPRKSFIWAEAWKCVLRRSKLELIQNRINDSF